MNNYEYQEIDEDIIVNAEPQKRKIDIVSVLEYIIYLIVGLVLITLTIYNESIRVNSIEPNISTIKGKIISIEAAPQSDESSIYYITFDSEDNQRIKIETTESNHSVGDSIVIYNYKDQYSENKESLMSTVSTAWILVAIDIVYLVFLLIRIGILIIDKKKDSKN
jgi:hypothetical protein